MSAANLTRFFTGKKEKWLPLYRRVVARLTSRLPGLEMSPEKTYISVSGFGVMWISPEGLELGMPLANPNANAKPGRFKESRRSPRRITQRILITSVSDLDDELLNWIKTARHQARTSKPRSI